MMHQRVIITLIPNRNGNFIYVLQKYNFSIGFKRNEIASRSREDLVTFRDSSMQDCNHLPSLVSRGWRRATGDDEEEAKRTENVERGGERGKQGDGQGDGERAERERTRASGRQRAEGGGRRAEGGGRRAEGRGRRTERGNEGKKRRDDTISIR